MISNNKPREKTSVSKKKRRWRILLIIVVVLVAVRLALPYVVLRIVNDKLSKIDGYIGHVEDIDLALIVGSYKIKDIKLEKTGGKIPVPFFKARVINMSIEWKALFHGGLKGEIEVYDPQLNYVNGPTEETSQTKIDKDWTEVVDELMPLEIDRFEINNGEIHYRDYHSSPNVDIYSKNIHIVAENLSNRKDQEEILPSTVDGTADVYGGKAILTMKLDALNKTPTFDVNAELQNLDLKELNDFILAYGNFDVNQGIFNLYTEAAARDGKITGYAKPIVKDLDVLGTEDRTLNEKVWNGVVGFVAWVFKNHPKDQVATRIDFEGSTENPQVNIWSIIGETLRNAFIKALYASIENTISIKSVGTTEGEKKNDGFLKNIFKKDEKKSDKKEEKKKQP